MRFRWLHCLLTTALLVPTACTKKPATKEGASSSKQVLGLKVNGTSGVAPQMNGAPPELQKVFAYIDAHIDEHAENLQKWIQQPSISNSGEGIPESAEMVKGFFDKLGCQTTRVYDLGITEYGSPANPVVYAKCDEGAPKTVAIYWQYDTMPVTQPDLWVAPPFEGRIVPGSFAGLPDIPRVIVGRGAVNSKGPEMAQLNALMAYKQVNGKLPVNLIFVAEGDEERMDIGLRKFIKDHSDLLAEADALFVGGPSEGCVYVELTTSGKRWGRGPDCLRRARRDEAHDGQPRLAPHPHARFPHLARRQHAADRGLQRWPRAAHRRRDGRAQKACREDEPRKDGQSQGVARYMSDDPVQVLKDGRFGVSFNLDGIWGGNMYAGGAGAICRTRSPPSTTSAMCRK